MQNETNNIEKLTNNLQICLKKNHKNNWLIWLLMCVGIGVYLKAVCQTMTLLWVNSSKNPYDFSLVILFICIFSFMIILWIKFLSKIVSEMQSKDKIWQVKLTDAYGKLLENQVKLDNEEVERQNKNNKSDEK